MDTDWSKLPVDLFMRQVTYLPYHSIIALCSTNVRLHNYCSVNNNRWKPLILSTFSDLPNFTQTLKNMQKHLFDGADLYDYQVYTRLQASLLDPVTQAMILVRQGDMESFNKLNPEVQFLALFLLNRRDIIKNYIPKYHSGYYPTIYLNYSKFLDILDKKEIDPEYLSALAALFAKWNNLRGVNLMRSKGVPLKDALKEASAAGQLNMVKYLVEHGADVHYNHMAFMGAIDNGNIDVVRYLVEKGADVHVYGNAALKSAIRNQHQDTVDYLRSLP